MLLDDLMAAWYNYTVELVNRLKTGFMRNCGAHYEVHYGAHQIPEGELRQHLLFAANEELGRLPLEHLHVLLHEVWIRNSQVY